MRIVNGQPSASRHGRTSPRSSAPGINPSSSSRPDNENTAPGSRPLSPSGSSHVTHSRSSAPPPTLSSASTNSTCTDSNSNDTRLLASLRKLGYQMQPMRGDGNCLFRAIAYQVYGDAEMHDTVRAQCIKHMLAERDHYAQFIAGDFDEYIARKRQLGCFGNNTEIQACAELYNRPIEVYQHDTEPLNIFHNAYAGEVPPIRLSYHNNNHYNAVIDPERPSMGVGLGLPGLQRASVSVDKLQTKRALQTSEVEEAERDVLHALQQTTELEDAEQRILAAVLQESRRQQQQQQQMHAQQPTATVSTTTPAVATVADADDTTDLIDVDLNAAIERSLRER